MAATSRREMVRGLVGEITRVAQELAPFSWLRDEPPAATGPAPTPRARSVRAGPTRRMAPVDELLALASELGLEGRVEDVRALARASARLTPGEPGAGTAPPRSRVGRAPDLPASVEWPRSDGKPLRFFAQLDLAEVSSVLGATTGLPSEGMLWCFRGTGAPSETSSEHADASRVIFAAQAPPSPEVSPPEGLDPEPGRSLALSGELVLPRVWSAPVVAIGLGEAERDAWEELRRRLGELQGAEPADTSRQVVAIHRVLGYPDERRGDMPLACELLARGHDLGGAPPHAHSHATELESRADRWRLLLQISSDDDAGWSWGARRERFYLWIEEGQLAAGELSGARPIIQ